MSGMETRRGLRNINLEKGILKAKVHGARALCEEKRIR